MFYQSITRLPARPEAVFPRNRAVLARGDDRLRAVRYSQVGLKYPIEACCIGVPREGYIMTYRFQWASAA